MKNVYDILKDDKLIYILPSGYLKKDTYSDCSAVAVIVNLYYVDSLEIYLGYIDRIPEEIDVYIISSNPLAEEKIKAYISGKDHIRYLGKENRGRDVSALLVTSRNLIKRYKYICFIHDKKPNFDYLSEDISFWNRNLWDNTLKSKQYIYNVLGIFEEYDDIGLLVPPKPVGSYIPDWYTDAWHDDFDIVRQLCTEFGLKCDLDFQKPVVTLGTVFWGRTEIFHKLLSKDWKYEDFADEPMPVDGTVSHGLERVLAYAAQDAGFKTGIVMCSSYAEDLVVKIQDMMWMTYRHLKENFYIGQIDQLKNYGEQKKQVSKICDDGRSLYLYGAGKYGCRFLNMMHMWGYSPKGFLVSDGHRKTDFIEGYPVWELGELRDSDAFIAITANYDKQNEMEHNLKSYGFKNYFIAC